MNKFDDETLGERLSSYMEKRRKTLITILITAVVLLVVYGGVTFFSSNSSDEGLTALDSISYTLTQNSADLSEEELAIRRDKALGDLEKWLKKGGIVGVRANMLAGEIAYSKGDFENSAKYWNDAAKKAKKTYNAPLSYFNAGVSYENIGDLDNAEKCYKNAIDNKDFLMATHALFSLGRVKEAKGDEDGAIETYNTLCDKSPDSSWGELAKSRLLVLEK